MRFLALAFVVGIGALAAFAVVSSASVRAPYAHGEEKTDMPNAAAVYRAFQRRNSDGTPADPQAIIVAKQERDHMVALSDGGGIFPGSWTWLGPGNIGGRVRSIIFKPGDPNTIWIASASGGIWKTTTGGTTWAPVDDFLPTLSVSTLVIDPTNVDVLYAGTGEGFFESLDGSSNTAAVRGAGIFKSVDGGSTWKQISSTVGPDWYAVNRLALQPGNPSVVLAATGSGLWRSVDAGQTWTRVVTAYVYDVRFDPSDGSKAVAGLHDDGAVWSADGGQNWTAATGVAGHRTELSYAPSNTSIVYASVSQNDANKVYRSLDGGHSFTLRTSGGGVSNYSAYNNTIWVNPANSDNVVVGGVDLFRSNDGGVTFAGAYGNVHSDLHTIVSHPNYNGSTNRTIYFGCDGGVFRAADANLNAVTSLNNNLGITQFYGAVQNASSGVILGGTQDNFTLRFTGNPQAWTATFGGDGGYTQTDPTNSNYFYGEIYYAQIFRSTNGGSSASYIWNGITDAGSATFCNFIPHFLLDPNNPNTMIAGARRLWRSTNVKASTPTWTAIKPAIPGGDGDEIGGIDNAHFLDNSPFNISTLAIAQSDSNVIWVGYNNGEVWKTTNGTATNPTWTRMDDLSGPMPNRWVGRIDISPTDANKVYVAYMGWSDDNVWKTTNGGGNWTQITGAAPHALPAAPVSCIRVHPTQPGWLYVGTDVGLFTSNDDGLTWTTSTQGPGTVPVEELHFVTPTNLLCVTHGRGLFRATVSLTTQPVTPITFSVVRGVQQAGQLSSVFSSDDVRLSIRAGVAATSSDAPVQVDFEGVSPIQTPSALNLRLEGHCTVGNLTSRVQAWDYVAGSFVEVDSRPATTADSQLDITMPNAGRFVEATTRRMRIRVSYKAAGPVSSWPWRGNIDQILWSVTP